MIYLIRHGLDDERYIGGHSSVDLVEYGIKQVDDLGRWIYDQRFDVNRIFTSDIKRAVSTANIINKYLNLPVSKTSELRELDKGLLTGLRKQFAMLQFPDYIYIDDINVRYPNGESMLDFYDRVAEIYSKISFYENSLVVTHRGVINMLYCLVTGEPPDMDKEKYEVDHASIHELDLVKSRIRRIK